MAGKIRNSEKTKNALADAMLELLMNDCPITKIRVKQLTDASNVDRQTFYYHFKNTMELCEFAYQRELEKFLASKGVGDIEKLDWRTRAIGMMEWLEENPSLRKTILPSLSDRSLREELRRLLYVDLEQTFLPHLLEVKMPSQDARQHLVYISCMLEALSMNWLNGDIDDKPMEILDRVEEMLRDYTAGVAIRMAQ